MNHLKTLARRAAKALRVLGLLALFCAIVSFLSVRHAVAVVKDELLDFGSHLALLVGDDTEGPQRLVINGHELGFEVATTELVVAEALDTFESWCQHRDGRFYDQWRELHRATVSTPVESSRFDSTLREDDEHRGFVACLDTGSEEALSPAGLVERLRHFHATGDVSDLGKLYYVRAERLHTRTRLIAVWATGTLHLGAMFPEAGDAPGRDVEGVPRPLTGRRLLSARPGQAGYTWTLYGDVEQTPVQVQSFYRAQLVADGWQLTPIKGGGAQQFVFAARRAGRVVFIAIARGARGTNVSMAETVEASS